MAVLESRMTQKGQVTIPAEVRTELGLKPGDVVQFEEHDGHWFVAPRKSRLAHIYGAVTPRSRPENWRSVREEVEASIAREVVAED
jgi:AbrB family looped-hinge helix DNA binding protein